MTVLQHARHLIWRGRAEEHHKSGGTKLGLGAFFSDEFEHNKRDFKKLKAHTQYGSWPSAPEGGPPTEWIRLLCIGKARTC